MNEIGEYIINLKNIYKNIKSYKKCDKKSKICAVVKANAYGVGAKIVVQEIDKIVDLYAVANFFEAREVREFTQKPILVLNYVDKKHIEECISKNIQMTISTLNQLKKLVSFSKNGKKLQINLAVDTGMKRLGFDDFLKFEKAVKFIKKNKNIFELNGIFSHIYNATNQKDVKKQNCIFMQYLRILSKYYDLKKITKHLLASEGAIRYKNIHYDMVRLGILLYANFDNKNRFLDAIELHSKVIQIKKIKKGESVGYGKSFVAKKSMKIAVVPVGYADGIFRNYDKNGCVLCNGEFCKVVGNVCMDMFMIDVSNTRVKVGQKVTIIGKNGDKNISLLNFAKWADTIPYEVLTNIKQKRFLVKIK